MTGVVVRVLKSGLAYVEDGESKKRFVFRFGRIKDYRGETAQELNLRIGSPVRFSTTGDLVEQVELLAPANRRSRKCA